VSAPERDDGALRFLPVGLDLRGRACLVVGGGVIGTRKALTLAHCGARVTVVSPGVTAALAEAAAVGLVRHVAGSFREVHLEGAFLVVAATDDEELNEQVARGAARSGALVCDASSADRSQVTFGAMARHEDATVAVFTDGRDPGHARRTRDRIASFLDRTPGSRGSPSTGAAPTPRVGPDVSEIAADGSGGPDGASLLMIGASVAGALPPGDGPVVPASDASAFARLKWSHRSVRTFLDGLLANTNVREALVWNTCQRLELYAWLPRDMDAGARRRLEEDLRGALFGVDPAGLRVGVLNGTDARHHLLRTACGLESELPGDRDVTAQLETACRSARTAGTAGPRTVALVEDAVALARDIRENTTWRDFATGYCAAALARVFEVDGIRPEELRCVVIGGSTTSRSVLTALRIEHHVPERQLAVVYRQHHGQMKELRAALGNGRRLRVHGYRDERVLRALAGADLVVFGIDQTEPVMDAETLLGLRDLAARPLTVVDFNSSGSVAGIAGDQRAGQVRLWSGRDLDRAVATHVAITITRPGFAEAVGEAELRIRTYLGDVAPSGAPLATGEHGASPAERTGRSPC
jgi:siroheme synthase-like protein